MGEIRRGKCDDLAVSELKRIVSELTDPDREIILTDLKDIALASDNAVSVAASIKCLLAFSPMEPGLEDTLEIRILELIANRTAFSNRMAQEAIAEFLYLRVSEQIDRAEHFVDALIQLLDERSETVGTTAYNTLMIVAANRPEYFQQHAGLLIKMLGSINKATRIRATRLISVLAMSHPEYVADAEKTLLHISSFNPDAELKNSASEALQILSSKLKQDEPAPVDNGERLRQEPETTGGLARILRSKISEDREAISENRIDKGGLPIATNFAGSADQADRKEDEGMEAVESDAEAIDKIIDDFHDIARSIKAEASSDVPEKAAEAMLPEDSAHESLEEIELRRMMEKVKEDFSINVGNILDAIGMSHLAKKPDEAWHQPAEVPAKEMAGEEEDASPTEPIASIESVTSHTEKEHAEQALAPASPSQAEPIVPMAAHGANDVAPEDVSAASSPVPETLLPAMPPEAPKPDAPASGRAIPRPLRMPIVPSGVRISTTRFKSNDLPEANRTPVPPKIYVKPSIKPLNRMPIDGVKIAGVRQHPDAGGPLAMRGQEPSAEAAPGQVVCHSCNALMPEDSQRCAICGSDLRSLKVRCLKCGEINLRGVGKCNRCGSVIDE